MTPIFENVNSYLSIEETKFKSPYFGEISPLVTFIKSLNKYESWASGDDADVGILLNEFYNIPSGTVIKILPCDTITFKICYVDKKLSIEELGLFNTNDYNFNFFHKVGIPIKFKILKFTINTSESYNEVSPYTDIVSFDDFFDSWLNKINGFYQSEGINTLTKESLANRWKKIFN